MCIGLGRAALASLLLLGCTGLNPLYADATGGQPQSGPGTTTRGATGPDPSLPTDPSAPTTPTTQSTLEPTVGSSNSTTQVGSSTSETTGTSSEDSSGTTTGGVPVDCSTYEQDDCPPDEKCMPWADDRGETWNALDCFPLSPTDLGDPGDECVVFETATSGLDDCNETSMCWDVNTETNGGTCVPFCFGSPDDPACANPDQSCVQTNDGVIALCLRLCNPLDQDCEKGSACLPATEGFTCVPDASGPGGEVGDLCEYINDCNPGSYCEAEEFLNDCGSPTCCTSFCDLEDVDTCEGPSVCLAYYEGGAAPAGYEDVGYCGAV